MTVSPHSQMRVPWQYGYPLGRLDDRGAARPVVDSKRDLPSSAITAAEPEPEGSGGEGRRSAGRTRPSLSLSAGGNQQSISITDFNDAAHRTESVACLQKSVALM